MRTILERVSQWWTSSGVPAIERDLGPCAMNEGVLIAAAATELVLTTPSLAANRRHVCELLLAITAVGGAEYVQALRVSVVTDGTTITVTSAEPIYTLLDGVFVLPAAFLFNVTFTNTLLALEVNVENVAGAEVNSMAALTLGLHRQPEQPA